MNSFELAFISERFLEIWSDFCEQHVQVYDLTCEEYNYLLASDIDQVEQVLKLKEEKLQLIGQLDHHRLEILSQIKQNYPQVDKVSDILHVFEKEGLKDQALRLDKLNKLLLDILEKIQLQSKRNQVFLNKAISSLRDLKRSFQGEPSHTTYGPKGNTKSTISS